MNDFDGAMCALVPASPPTLGEGYYSPEKLHLTLAFFGDDSRDLTPQNRGKILGVSRAMPEQTFDLKVAGFDLFGTDREYLVAKFEEDTKLRRFRDALVYNLNLANIWYSTEYEYVPHMTLGVNVSPPETFPTRIVFSKLIVAFGGSWVEVSDKLP